MYKEFSMYALREFTLKFPEIQIVPQQRSPNHYCLSAKACCYIHLRNSFNKRYVRVCELQHVCPHIQEHFVTRRYFDNNDIVLENSLRKLAEINFKSIL